MSNIKLYLNKILMSISSDYALTCAAIKLMISYSQICYISSKICLYFFKKNLRF